MDQGRLSGFNIEVANRLAVVLNVAIAFLPMSHAEALVALEQGKVDLILGYPYNPAQADRLVFSEALAASSIAALVTAGDERFRDGLADLADSVVALTRGSGAYNFLKQIRTIRFNETALPADAFRLLELGRADVLLEDRLVLRYFMQDANSSSRFRFAASYWLPVEYVMAVARDNAYLAYLLNSGLREIKERGLYASLYSAWFNDAELEAQRRLRLFLNAFAILATIFVVIAGLGFWWNRQLSERVRKRTAELHKVNAELQVQIGQTEDRNQFISQILESSPRGIMACTADGIVTSCNRRARELGCFTIEPVGASWEQLPPLDRMLRDRLAQVAGNGQRFLFQTMEWLRGDGQNLQLRYNLYPFLDHDRRPGGVICTFEDYTEEKLLRDRIFEREKNEALGRIVAGMAHEIRNPLTSIKAFVDLLPRKLDNPHFREELLAFVPKEVERVDGLIRNLIDFARPATSTRSHEDLSELSRSILSLLLPLAEKRGAHIRFSPAPGLQVSLDRDQYKQGLLNFIMNALDALDEKRESSGGLADDEQIIDVVLSQEAGMARLVVSDRGIGMEPEQLDRIFEPFYTTKSKGVGLGLPLTRQFILENHGSLRIESIRGQGTTVYVEFPRMVPHA
jgi:polar amino acid transport system substrate-binding protein